MSRETLDLNLFCFKYNIIVSLIKCVIRNWNNREEKLVERFNESVLEWRINTYDSFILFVCEQT